MSKNFTLPVPNELYINSFSEGKTIDITYENLQNIILLVDRQSGYAINKLDQLTDAYNPDTSVAIEVDASTNPEVVYFYTTDRKFLSELQNKTITNIDGSTHEEVAEPTIFHYYSNFIYNFETSTWSPELITKDTRSALYIQAENGKQYVLDNLSKIESDANLTAMANAYLTAINNYQTTGNGSIYSWRLTTWNLSEVPQVPPPLVIAFLAN